MGWDRDDYYWNINFLHLKLFQMVQFVVGLQKIILTCTEKQAQIIFLVYIELHPSEKSLQII